MSQPFSHDLLRAIAQGAGVRYLAPAFSRIARDADCSPTLVRRYLCGERVGEKSAARLRHVLDLARDPQPVGRASSDSEPSDPGSAARSGS